MTPDYRPVVWINCAVSADGRLAYSGGRRARLSGPTDRERVHRLRAHSDGILVGATTVELDDPALRIDWELLGEPARTGPYRIVADSTGRTPRTARILDGSAPTIVLTGRAGASAFPPSIPVIVAGEDRVDLGLALRRLKERGLERLLVEGGGEIIASLLKAGLFDRWTVYVAPVVIGGRSAPCVVAGEDLPAEQSSLPLRLRSAERIDEGVLLTWEPGPAPTPPGSVVGKAARLINEGGSGNGRGEAV